MEKGFRLTKLLRKLLGRERLHEGEQFLLLPGTSLQGLRLKANWLWANFRDC